MPLLLVVLVIVAFVFWNLGRGSRNIVGSGSVSSRARRCDWVGTGNDTTALGEYRCKYCKVVAYAKPGEHPKECKRGLGGSL